MNRVYIDQAWSFFEERQICFTCRSIFKSKIKDLPGELQAIIFVKVWNKGKDTLRECMRGTTNQTGHHNNHEGFLYKLYFTQAVVPMYVKDFEKNFRTLNTKYD